MLDQNAIWGTLIGAALLAGIFQALAEINQFGWRNTSPQRRISMACYPLTVPLSIFVGIFFGMLALGIRCAFAISARLGTLAANKPK
jgi:hypothetical protein